MGRIITSSAGTSKRSPNVSLTAAIGNYVVGTFDKTVESKAWPGTYSHLLKIEDTNAPIVLFNKETKSEDEVNIEAGESVFLKSPTVLTGLMREVKSGERVKITYTGKGVAKKGRKAPYIFQVEVL